LYGAGCGREKIDGMTNSDDPRIQRLRVSEAVEHAYEGSAEAVFDETRPVDWLRFRIDDKGTGRVISSGAPEYHVTEIADMSDERLRQVVAALAPYFCKV
jgi:hypothetical protein